MIKRVLLRIPNDLHEQIKLLACQFNMSINKMYIKILYRGVISFMEAIGGDNESSKSSYNINSWESI